MMSTATISMETIKILREETGAGVMDVKKALADAEGDLQKAREILRQKGAATAEKKAARVAAEGLIVARLSEDKRRASIVEVNCETDFAAKNERFVAMVHAMGDASLHTTATDVEGLMNDNQQALQTMLTDTVGAIRENMKMRRFEQVALPEGQQGLLHTYIHGGGKIGVVVALSATKAETVQAEAFQALTKDIALHAAAYAPQYISRHDIPGSVIEEETRIEMGKEDLASKPEAMRAKIVEGRVSKILGAVVLLEQAFVKDPSKTVEAMLKEVGTALGDTLEVRTLVRYVLGEGVDKTQQED
jgi:elongation factor Ts